MKKIFFLLIGVGALTLSNAQTAALREGNKLYKEGKFDEAVEAYDKVIKKTPSDATALYNRSNALAKKGDREAALEGYTNLLAQTKDEKIMQRALYDKGVMHQQLQQLEESINAWKAALKLDPDDQQARENLQKALREKKKEEEKKKKEEEKKEKEDKKQEQKQEPKPQRSRLNQQQVEQLLKALEQKEKEVQKKMQQKSASPNRPEKDW